MKHIIPFLVLLFACSSPPRQASTPVDIGSVDVPLFEYTVGYMHRGWYPYSHEYEGDLRFRGIILLEDEHADLSVDAYDLTSAHLAWAHAWRDYWTAQGVAGPVTHEAIAECLQAGAIYVPKDDESFTRLCGGDLSRVACYHAPEVFELSVNYVQVIRWDWYRAIGEPELMEDYIHIITHEIGHHVAKCAYGTADNHHELDVVFEDIHEIATQNFIEDYRGL